MDVAMNCNQTTEPPKAYSYVRMSTDHQLRGDSLRRQCEISRQYAADNGLDLVQNFRFQDIGVSAFKGANADTGALGAFLKAVSSGQIKSGSFLLVESLDRISRQGIMESLPLFMKIIQSGINIVTLADQFQYEAGKVDMCQLMMSMLILSRAHEESKTKSFRVSQSWLNRRRNADTRIITSVCPAWLVASKNKRGFELIPERVEIVNRIFELSRSGIGCYGITRILNQSGCPTFGSVTGWHDSYVFRILKSKAVIGEMQSFKPDGAKRVPCGDPVPGYYPAVVDRELFFHVQGLIAQRRNQGGGRKGENITNLFSKIARCAYCGSGMRLLRTGNRSKDHSYFVCNKGRRGAGCSFIRWRYDHFEASFLAFVHELNLGSFSSGSQLAKDDLLLKQKFIFSAATAEAESKRDKLLNILLERTHHSRFLSDKLHELELEIAAISEKVSEIDASLLALSIASSRFYDSKDRISDLVDRVQCASGPEAYALRSAISSKLSSIISDLFVATAGGRPISLDTIGLLESDIAEGGGNNNRDSSFDLIYNSIADELSGAQSDHPFFIVKFKDGTVRGVRPKKMDPLDFESQIISEARGLKFVRRVDAGSVVCRQTEASLFSPDPMTQLAIL